MRAAGFLGWPPYERRPRGSERDLEHGGRLVLARDVDGGRAIAQGVQCHGMREVGVGVVGADMGEYDEPQVVVGEFGEE